MRLCISIASILFVTIPAVAATVTVRPETPDRPIVVVIEGSLAAFDEDQFAAKTAPLSSAFVAFSSDGGSLVAGLQQTGPDRFTLDRTHMLIGDFTQFPIAARLGREVVPFGTSTGVARLDT